MNSLRGAPSLRAVSAGPRDSATRSRRVASIASLAFAAAFATASHANGDEARPPAPQPLEECARQTAARVQSFYESVRDIDARFAQSTQSVALGTGAAAGESTSTGRVVVAKPGRMRWEYESPRPNLVVSDGSTLWIYDPQTREAQHFAVASGYLTGAALSFLLGEGSLDDEFRVDALRCTAELAELDLHPRTDAGYERLGLVVARSTGEVRETRVVDLFGNVTTVRFRDVRINASPPASTFDFSPPEDAKVFDLTGS